MKYGSLFAGYGGLEMGVSSVLGGEPAWFSEIDKAPSRILAHHWPTVPNLGDITAIDWDAVEPVDVLTGGFPCQDVSHAGKRLGLKPGTRSGLWSHMAYAIDRLRPRLVVAENVRGLLSAEAGGDLEPCPWCVGNGEGSPLRALGAVQGDLADLGYASQWVGLRAADAGAPHGRFRVFIYAWPTADADRDGCEGGGRVHPIERDPHGRGGADIAWGDPKPATPGTDTTLTNPRSSRLGEHSGGAPTEETRPRGSHEPASPHRPRPAVDWGPYAPAIRRWEHVTGRLALPPTEPGKNGNARLSPAFVEWMMGLPPGHVTAVSGLTRNDQLKALGNGVVPAQAALATRAFLASQTQESAA